MALNHDFKKYPELNNNQMQFYYWDSPHKQITEGFIAKVVKVIDGDTVRVEWGERDFDFPVRMIDIDAPEIGEGGARSKQWLANRILGEEVYIVINERKRVGKWGRILGEIIHQGININEESITAMRAVPFEVER